MPTGDEQRPASPNPPRTVPEKIREWLNGHGFPLEMQTAKTLHRADYHVQQSTYFETGSPRFAIAGSVTCTGNNATADSA